MVTSIFDNKCKIPREEFSIGLPLMTDPVSFAQLLGRFLEKYPEIETELYEYGSKKIEIAIKDGLLRYQHYMPSAGQPPNV